MTVPADRPCLATLKESQPMDSNGTPCHIQGVIVQLAPAPAPPDRGLQAQSE